MVDVTRILDQSGGNHDFVDAGSSTRPTVTAAGALNRTAADFDGVNQYMDAGAALSSFITNNTAYVVLACIVDAVTFNDNAPHNNHCLLGDANQRFGLYARALNELTVLAVNR
jgi:hypothetical protein